MLFRRIGQPAVVGEIAAGLVLGPSLFGALLPQLWSSIFHPAVGNLPPELADVLIGKIFTVLSQLGLIFLLFLVGLEVDFSHLRWHGQGALAISIAGVAVPFVLGLGVAWLLWPYVEAHPQSTEPVPQLGFVLFMGLALSITAIPVLGRIMIELNITRTRIGAVTISAAAVGDATGWIILATIAAIVQAEFNVGMTLRMAAQTVAFFLVMLFLVRPLLRRWVAHLKKQGGQIVGVNSLAVLLTLSFVCAIATNLIGIFAVFGAFLLGAVLSDEVEFRQAITTRMRDLVHVFFLPIFFAYLACEPTLAR
jgi:Kef-type K+ transport system membrane component KefB